MCQSRNVDVYMACVRGNICCMLYVVCTLYMYVCLFLCQNRNVDVYMACVRGNIFCMLYVVCTLYMYVCMCIRIGM